MSGRATISDVIMRLDPSVIEVRADKRIGLFHADKAAALGRLIAMDGQRDPIKVAKQGPRAAKPWLLVVGMHRLEGIKLEQLPEVLAIEVSGNAEDLVDMESSENLHRRPLAPIERAKFVHALCEAATLRMAREHGDLSQQQIAIKSRWARVKSGEVRVEQALQEETDDTADKMSKLYGWQDSAADALGLDKRTIRRALELFRLVIEPFPDLTEQLAHHPIVGENASQLKLIADIRDEGERRKVIEALLADDDLSADIARIQAGVDRASGPAPTKDQKFANTIGDSWNRLSLSAKRDFLPQFVGLLTPDMTIRLRELVGGEPAASLPTVEVKSALKTAFDVIASLSVGDHVDDDQLEAARRELQGVLLGTNSLVIAREMVDAG